MYANCNTKKVSVKARKIPSNKEKEGDHIDITYYPRYDTILRENMPCFSNIEYHKKNPSDTCYDCILKQPDIEIECPKCGNKNGDGIILLDHGVILRMDENGIPIRRAKSYIRWLCKKCKYKGEDFKERLIYKAENVKIVECI